MSSENIMVYMVVIFLPENWRLWLWKTTLNLQPKQVPFSEKSLISLSIPLKSYYLQYVTTPLIKILYYIQINNFWPEINSFL